MDNYTIWTAKSSAYKQKYEYSVFISVLKSLSNTVNSVGPKVDSWGTPVLTGKILGKQPLGLQQTEIYLINMS